MRHAPITADEQLTNALANLAIARGGILDEVTFAVYSDALADLEPSLVERACRQFALEPRADYESVIPSVGLIRERVTRIALAPPKALRQLPPAPGEPTYRCATCHDDPNGWIDNIACPEVSCGRHKAHAPHFFAVRCPCWLDRNADALTFSKQEALKNNKAVPADCDALAELREGRYRFAKPRAMWATPRSA